jgi:hypothetical protein
VKAFQLEMVARKGGAARKGGVSRFNLKGWAAWARASLAAADVTHLIVAHVLEQLSSG